MDDQTQQPDYDYSAAGFDDFMSRSIDSGAQGSAPIPVRQVNFDQQQISGSLGDILRIGSIFLDGVTGRISIYDGDTKNEVVRLGKISDG